MKKLTLSITLYLFAFSVYAQSWDSVGTGIDGGINFGRVFTLTEYNGSLYAGGGFSAAGGNSAKSVAKWDGISWAAITAETFDATTAFAVFNDKLYIGGSFQGIFGTTPFIVQWDGTNLLMLPNNTLIYAVEALCVYNNWLYAGETYNTSGRYIYKTQNNVWQNTNSGINSWVHDLTTYNGELYAAGSFTMAGGDSVNRIAKWNDTIWSDVGGGLDQVVWCLAVHNGELYAGGNFSSRVSKWDGTNWTAIGNGFNADVRALCSFNGMLYAGGDFTTAGGTPANYIAQWDGINWSALGDGVDSTVFALCIYDSVLYAGGLFSHAGGIPANRIAKWNPLGIGMLESVNENEVDVYPNPATTTLTLTTEQTLKNAALKIMNAIGQEVSHPLSRGECASLSAGKGCVLDISSLPPGLYYLTLQSNEGVAVKKFEVIR